MIDFEHVSKEYKKGGRLALEDINLHVDDGEFVFLLGHSVPANPRCSSSSCARSCPPPAR